VLRLGRKAILPISQKILKKGKAMDEEKILTIEEKKRILEAVLFAAGHPVTFKKLSEVIGIGEKEVAALVAQYATEYESCGLPRGIQLLQLGNACQLVTKEVFAPYIKEALGVKDGGNLSKASLETLAVIAYNQPVTRSYIDQVRGVDSAYSIGVLIDRELITEMGRMDVPGRPRLYGTTEVFLRVFGLSNISELPPLALAGGEGV
jgi:segregation and condensation protein B